MCQDVSSHSSLARAFLVVVAHPHGPDLGGQTVEDTEVLENSYLKNKKHLEMFVPCFS